jgi:DNA-binding SARP family transcriptional activator
VAVNGHTEYGILGPVEVRRNGDVIELSRPKLRALLAVLLLDADRVVPRDRLIDSLWGDEPPPTVDAALHTLVSQLRKALGSDAVVRRAPGYLLSLNGDSLDLARFDDLHDRGREALEAGQNPLAAELLSQALDLWRGEPLADCMLDDAVRTSLAARLESHRLAALEDRFDAELAAGHHGQVVGDLERLVVEYPIRERLRGQLMLALYRSGRQSDALSVYRAGHAALVGGLGITPSPKLRALERAILQHDPALDLPAAGDDASVVAAESPGAARRRPVGGWKAPAAAAIVVAVIGLVILAWSRSGEAPTPLPAPPGTTQTVRSGPLLPAQGVWVVNTATAQVMATIPMPAHLADTTTAGRYAWAAYGRGILRFNPLDGLIDRRIAIPGGATGVAYAAHRLWVMQSTGRSYHTNVLLVVNPRMRAIHRISVPHAFDTVYAGDGFVWVPGERRIARIDPAAGRVDGAIPFGLVQGNLFGAVAFTPGAMWIAKWAAPYKDQLIRINTQTLRVTRHVPVPISETGQSYLVAAGDHKIWVATADGGRAIYEYNQNARRTGTIPVGGLAWMSGSRGALWFQTDVQPTVIQAVSAGRAALQSVQLLGQPLGFQVIGNLLYAEFTG